METKTCPDCGKENIKRMDLHKVNCPGKKQQEIEKEIPEKKEELVRVIVSITNVMEYDVRGSELAWFETEEGEHISKPINYMGSFSDGKTNIQTVLVLANDGILVPPFMIAGFLGIFPESFVFPDVQEEIHETEPPKPEEKQPVSTTSTSEMIEKFKQKDNAVVAKPSFMNRLIGKKEKEPSNSLSKETQDLLKQIPIHD